ncbi:methyltransferase family protein [Falsiroseomonas sp. HW251]|uniref:methyltransferase family protein n=1 Tax=Falsiroseomonas sp. HW251 TaxID=3390998 RepID=UPI003D311FAD
MSEAPRLSRIPWPPLLYLAAALAGLKLGEWFPMAWWPTDWRVQLAGLVVIAAALGFDLWAMGTMMRRRANILPNRPATALVTTGPFRITRNPIYLGNTVMVGGFAVAFGNPWFIPCALAAALAVNRLAIRREEAQLAALFGPEWDAYAARTRRWL